MRKKYVETANGVFDEFSNLFRKLCLNSVPTNLILIWQVSQSTLKETFLIDRTTSLFSYCVFLPYIIHFF